MPEYTRIENRRTNDPSMIASVGFKKQLWALDPELDVLWNPRVGRWEIWKFPGQPKVAKKVHTDKAHHIMTIKEQDGSFRDLGADILLKLQKGDTHKYTLKQLCDYWDQMDANFIRKKEKELHDYVEALTKEVVHWAGAIRLQVPKEYNMKRIGREIANG